MHLPAICDDRFPLLCLPQRHVPAILSPLDCCTGLWTGSGIRGRSNVVVSSRLLNTQHAKSNLRLFCRDYGEEKGFGQGTRPSSHRTCRNLQSACHLHLQRVSCLAGNSAGKPSTHVPLVSCSSCSSQRYRLECRRRTAQESFRQLCSIWWVWWQPDAVDWALAE